MCRLRRDGASDRPRWENGEWAGTAPHRRRRSGCTAGRHTAVKAGVPVRRPGFREKTVCAGVCTSSEGEGVSAVAPPRSCALDRALCVFSSGICRRAWPLWSFRSAAAVFVPFCQNCSAVCARLECGGGCCKFRLRRQRALPAGRFLPIGFPVGREDGCQKFPLSISRTTGHVYQMSTKKGAKPLGHKGFAFFHFLGVYQMSTKLTFWREKRPFFRFFTGFSAQNSQCKGRYTGLNG